MELTWKYPVLECDLCLISQLVFPTREVFVYLFLFQACESGSNQTVDSERLLGLRVSQFFDTLDGVWNLLFKLDSLEEPWTPLSVTLFFST